MIKKIVLICVLCICACSLYANQAITIVPEVSLKKDKSVKRMSRETAEIIIDSAEIKQTPSVTLPELLQQQQSVVRLTNNSADSSQTAVSIRGFGDNAAANSLILVDGFPLVNPSLLAPNLNNLSLLDIERIEILPGSQGSLWGNQAVGGILNIITKHPEKFFMNGVLGVGSFNKVFVNGLIGNRFERGLFIKGLLLLNQTDNYRVHQKQANQEGLLQLGKDYANGSMNLKLQQAKNTMQFPGGLSEIQYQQNPGQATEFQNYSSYQTILLQLFNKHALSEKWYLESRFSHYAIKGDGFVYFNYNRDEWMNSINPQLTGYINNGKIRLGYYLQQSNYHFHNSNIKQKVAALQQDVYAQLTLPVFAQAVFILGGRYANQSNQINVNNAFSAEDHVLVTEQGVTYQPNQKIKLYLRRDGNFRFPKTNELAWPTVNGNRLQAQIGTSYETGIFYQILSHDLQFNLYRLQLNNEIAFNFDQDANHPFGVFQNFKPTLRYGMSAADSWQLSDELKFIIQINAVDACFASGTYSGKHIPAVPTWNGLMHFQYQFLPHWQLKLISLYNGSQYPSEDNANTGKEVPGYWLQTAALQYTLNHFAVSFEIANLLNQIYSAYTLYDSQTQTNMYYPGSGRSILLTVKVDF